MARGVEGVSGGGRRGVGVKRDGRARNPETGIFYLSRLRGKNRDWAAG